MKKTYYFAYGSNLYAPQIEQRCPDSEYIKNVRLDGWLFRISPKHGGANIVQTNNNEDHVWGALYTLSDNDIETLNLYEGIDDNEYTQIHIDIEGIDEKTLTYVVPDCSGHDRAYKDYHERILAGLKQRGICNLYIGKFEEQKPKQENHPSHDYTGNAIGKKKVRRPKSPDKRR